MRLPYPKADLQQWAKETVDFLNREFTENRPRFPLLGRNASRGIAGLLQYDQSTGQVQVHNGTQWNPASKLPVTTVASLPAIGTVEDGTQYLCTDALAGSQTTGNGTGNIAVAVGANWRRIDDMSTDIGA